MDKKCKFCAMRIPKEAKICPHCRKALGWTTGAKFGLALLLLSFFIGMSSLNLSSNKPTEQITSPPPPKPILSVKKAQESTPQVQYVWREGIICGVLVPANTTPEQLKSLIWEFRGARAGKSLSRYVPAETPGIKGEPFSPVIIFVFSDPKWATQDEYKKYERANMRTQTGKSISKKYLNHIRASYWYDLDGKEYGSLGYDEGIMQSAAYMKIF